MKPVQFNLKPNVLNISKIAKEDRVAEDSNEIIENDKPQAIVKPQAKAVVAKSEELLSNYIMAEINKNVTAPVQQNDASDEASPLSAPAVAEGENDGVEVLIAEWNQNSETWTNNVKVEKLTNIIDVLERNGQNADIWRLRRFTVIHNMNTDDLFMYKCGHLGERPGRPYVDGDNFYEEYNTDYTIYSLYSRMYFTTGIEDDEMRSAFLEAKLSREVRWLEATLIDSKEDPNNQNNILGAKVNAQLTFVAFTQYADNIENAGWQEGFNKFRTAFMDFQNHISQFKNGEVGEGLIESDVTNMRNLLQEMADNGLSYFYCRTLLFCIEGYVTYVGLRHLVE